MPLVEQPDVERGDCYDAGKWANPWYRLCEQRIAEAKTTGCDLIFIGDSITMQWNSLAGTLWEQRFAPYHALNFGAAGDWTQNALWRLGHMNLDGLKPRVAVILLGTNNLTHEPEQIAAGIKAVVARTQERFPNITVLLISILPASRETARMTATNTLLPALCNGTTVRWVDVAALMPPQGDSWKGLGPDHLHLSPEGYRIWADALEPSLLELLGPRPPATGERQ
jgi:lysophospholipase L1-like esterase